MFIIVNYGVMNADIYSSCSFKDHTNSMVSEYRCLAVKFAALLSLLFMLLCKQYD